MKKQLPAYRSWVVLVCLAGILVVWLGVMVRQYQAVQENIEELVRVREEYQAYVLALKRLIGECQKQVVADDALLEKKKLNEERPDFLLLNRDAEYLKRSALMYARQHDLYEAVEQLYKADDFVAKSQRMGQKKPARLARSKKRRVQQPRAREEELPPGWWESLKREPIFISPIQKGDFWISSRFGPRKKPDGSWGFHHAVDMAAVKGTLVRAAGEGIVIEAGYSAGYGNTIVIAHNRKFKTRYAHLAKILTCVGAKVDSGTVIGKVGDTGSVRKRGRDGSHLHFEVSVFDKRVNPLYFIK